MKKIFTILFALSFYCLLSQIDVIQTKPEVLVGKVATPMMGYVKAKLTYNILENNDTVYTLMYTNAKYSKITDFEYIKFSSVDNTVNIFYDLLMSVFKKENCKNKEYKVSFKLGEDFVTVSTAYSMGITASTLMTSNGYVYFKESEIKKLFGKKR